MNSIKKLRDCKEINQTRISVMINSICKEINKHALHVYKRAENIILFLFFKNGTQLRTVTKFAFTALLNVAIVACSSDNETPQPPQGDTITTSNLRMTLEWDGGNIDGQNDLDMQVARGPVLTDANYINDKLDATDIAVAGSNSASGFEELEIQSNIADGEMHNYILCCEATTGVTGANWTLRLFNDAATIPSVTYTGFLPFTEADKNCEGNFVAVLKIVKQGNNFTVKRL